MERSRTLCESCKVGYIHKGDKTCANCGASTQLISFYKENK